MKLINKRLFFFPILLLFIFFPFKVHACDVCGCSSGGNSLGILPQFNNHFVGLRYSYKQFNTTHPPSIIPGIEGQNSDEYFHSLELWGRFYPIKRLQVFAFVPFHFYQQKLSNESIFVNTIGDISVLANYIFIQTPDTGNFKIKHNFQGGIGIKMPTGQFQMKHHEELLNPNLQPGTGSWDILFNLAYTLRYKKWGMNTEVVYRLNTPNPEKYKFGDKVTLSAKGFYLKEWNKFSLLPSSGLVYEYTFSNLDKNARVDYTGGNVFSIHAGIDLYWKRFSLGLSTQIPVWQNLSEGYVYQYPKANAQFLFMF